MGAPRGVQRALSTLTFLVIAAGVTGVAVHDPHTTHLVRSGQVHHAVPATPIAALPPSLGPGTAILDARLLTPGDLGGAYRVDDVAAGSFLASAPCLAGLAPSSAQTGRAVRGMSGPDTRGPDTGGPGNGGAVATPSVIEAVISYPGAASVDVYRSLVSALQECPAFGFSLQGIAASAKLSESALAAPGGEPSSLFSGQVQVAGATRTVQIALVADGQVVLAVVYCGDVLAPAATDHTSSAVAAALARLGAIAKVS